METTQNYSSPTSVDGSADRSGMARKAVRTSVALSDFIARTIREALRRRRARKALHAQRQALAALDDRTLRDIGLHRSEIDSLVVELDGAVANTRRRAHPDSVAPLY